MAPQLLHSLLIFAEFPVSQSTKFCPGTTYPDSPDDPSNLVFTPIGPAETTTAADLNGSYSVTDELGLAGVCMRFDEAQTLVVSLNQQTVDVFGELTATFNSVSGSITNFVVSYGMLLACSLWLQLSVVQR